MGTNANIGGPYASVHLDVLVGESRTKLRYLWDTSFEELLPTLTCAPVKSL